MKSLLVRATPISLGGFVLIGLLALIGTLTWIAFLPQEPSLALRITLLITWIGLFLYAVDAASERLGYEEGCIFFDSFSKKRKEIPLRDMDTILVVHEGLNQERGIISVRFHERDGRVIDWSLGPLWHRHHLEQFFSELEREAGKKKLFEHVR